MGNIAEMLIGSAFQHAQDAPAGPDIAGSMAKGIELATHVEQVKNQRAQIEQKKQEQQLQKFEKVGNWIETAAKMPDGAAKKAFVNKYIPTGIQALGIGDQIDPSVLDMIKGDPNLGSFIVSRIRNGDDDLRVLTSPEGVASLAASPAYAQFGGVEALKSAVDDYRPKIEEAEKDRISQIEKMKRAEEIAKDKGGQRGITNLGDLRREVTSHPITKTTIQTAEAYDKIRSAFGGKPSPAGDISGVFAYMKMLDPASTVREGEQAQARNAAGVPDQIQNAYNKALKGETLNAKQRADFTNRAEQLYRNQYNRQVKLNQDFESVARSTGIDPKLIFAGTKFKAPPPEKGTRTYDIGGRKATREQAQGFLRANPQFKSSLSLEDLKEIEAD